MVKAVPLGDEIEGRAKTIARLEVGESPHVRLPLGRFDVVRKHKGEFMPSRPEMDEGNSLSLGTGQESSKHSPQELGIARLDWPSEKRITRCSRALESAEAPRHWPGQDRLQTVVHFACKAEVPVVRAKLPLAKRFQQKSVDVRALRARGESARGRLN